MQPVLLLAQAPDSFGKGVELMGPMGFIYYGDTRESADAVVSYYAVGLDMDTPHLLRDAEKIELIVMEGVDYFFPELYSGDIIGALAERVGE